MLREFFAHHSFILEVYGYVRLPCRCPYVEPVVSVMDPVVDVHTRRSTHAYVVSVMDPVVDMHTRRSTHAYSCI